MRKTGAMLAKGFGSDEFEKDLENSFFGIYSIGEPKIIDIKYHSTNAGSGEPIHYSALIIYEYDDKDELQVL